MSRGIRDLRDLICVSRLTIRDSDEEYDSDEDASSSELDNLSLFSSGSDQDPTSKLNNARVVSPDSGVATNGSSAELIQAAHSHQEKNVSRSTRKCGRRKKKRNLATYPPRHELPKPAALPPVLNKVFDEIGCPGNPPVLGDQRKVKEGNFDNMLCYMDATVVAGWLTKANETVIRLAQFCNSQDNFIQFAHFWLTDFPDMQKQDIFRMEHEILVEEINLAFATGKDSRKVFHTDTLNLVGAVFKEYPVKLLSSKGPHLFLDYLDILISERAEHYKKLLSDVRCSTRNRQFAQWLLATRSFALINVWSAIVNFYQKLTSHDSIKQGLPSPNVISGKNVHQQWIHQAIRLGFVDVVHYLLVQSHVSPRSVDSHSRSLVFISVMHKQSAVLSYLIKRFKPCIDVNLPSDTGNSPLHAAANNGGEALVVELLACPDIDVNYPNPQCENATPLHLAVMHGNENIVELLLKAGADASLRMGDLTVYDIAKDFGDGRLLKLFS